MTQFLFGVGSLILKRTDLTNTKPAFLGVIQDFQLDIDQSIKELMGQYKLAVDIAPAALKITGKAKFGRIQADILNNALLAQTETQASGLDLASAENHAVPASPYTVAVTNATSFIEDWGIFYASNGIQLQPVAASPTVGQYIAGAAGSGVYTFAAADSAVAGGINFYYSFTVSSLVQIAMTNSLMGVGPVVEMFFAGSYAVQGVTKKLNVKLNACRASKISFPTKNTDYTISELDFQAFADASGSIGTWASTE